MELIYYSWLLNRLPIDSSFNKNLFVTSVATYWKIRWHVVQDICALPREVHYIQHCLKAHYLEYGNPDMDPVPECKQEREFQKEPATEKDMKT